MSDGHDLYHLHAAAIEAALGVVCRRYHLAAADAEDFSGDCRLRLMKEDYAILRQFQGRSSLNTYLLVVITRGFQDWRNSRWGKWRPSAEARRLGPLAERLERLVVRDRHTVDEAHEILRTNLGLDVTRASLDELMARFPARQGRIPVGEQAIAELPASDRAPDEHLEAEQGATVARLAADALGRALAHLPAEDQLILKMRFTDGLSFAEVARTLHLDQKPLYRRVDRILLELRRALESGGLTAETLAAAMEVGGFDLEREMSTQVRLGKQPGLRIAGVP